MDNNQKYKKDEKSKDGENNRLKNVERNIETSFLFFLDRFFPVTLARKKQAATSSVIMPHYHIAYSKEK